MKGTFILLLGILVLSCNQQTKTNDAENAETEANAKTPIIENLDWLTGNWKRVNEEAGKETFENWKKISSSEYAGFGFTMQKGDTISQEKMDFIQSNGKWILLVKMPNEAKPTAFKMTEQKNNEFICLNDSNEFPKTIQYWMEGGKMKAKIANEAMQILFEFEKIK